MRDAARQLAVALHNAWTHDRLREKSIALAEQGERLDAREQGQDGLPRVDEPRASYAAERDPRVSPTSCSRRRKEQLSPRARESLERIKRNGEHLLSLINDVLDLAKAEAGRVEVRLGPVNVGLLARACVAEVESLRSGKNLRLGVDAGEAPIETVTDAQRVRQILINLLANALKFTDEGEVVLTVRATVNEVQIAVRDTGIGIPAHAMKELFQDFHQLEAGDGRRYEGTGVGLALSRRLARALGGEIDVRSRRGRGLDVHAGVAAHDGGARARRAVACGARALAAAAPQRQGALVSDPSALATLGDASGNVLIVDDFPDTLALYEAILSEDGHKVRTASSGLDALRKVDELEPELVLLDVSMPGLDGVEVLKRLRARRGGGPAVIMLTAARREPHAIEAGLKEGADAYLTKPIDARELVARVRAALETFRLKRVLEAQRRDHVAMLVHDLRHPLSSLGLIAEVLESEDLTAGERQTTVVADPQHVLARWRAWSTVSSPRAASRRASSRSSRAPIPRARDHRPDARGVHAGRHAPARGAVVRGLARPRGPRRPAQAAASARQRARQCAQVHAARRARARSRRA